MSKAHTMFYTLDDIINFSISIDKSKEIHRKLLNAKFSYQNVDDLADKDISISMHIGEFQVDKSEDCLNIDKDFLIKKDFIYFKGNNGGATQIKGFEEGTISIQHTPYPESIAKRITRGIRGVNMYLEPMLSWSLYKKNAVMLHAGAIAKNGKSLLICGTNGAGKTKLIIDLCVNHGWQFLGDDLVMLKDNCIVPFIEYPSVLGLRTKNFIKKKKRQPSHLNIIWDIARDKKADLSALNISQTPVPIGGTVLLNSFYKSEKAELSPISCNELWDTCMELEKLEFCKNQRRHQQVHNISRFIQAYEYVFPGSEIFNVIVKGEIPMPEAIKSVDSLSISLPKNIKQSVPEIEEAFNKILS